jgi:hypothetical protein
MQVLVVGGGGGSGGGVGGAGAGGGGGFYETLTYALQFNYAVTVGTGGAVGENGGNSVFDTIVAYGGGVGGATGGASGANNQGDPGYAGGVDGGAGGGAGEAGGDHWFSGAFGGDGKTSSIATGSPKYYGGGGGGVDMGNVLPNGGLGGGGTGGFAGEPQGPAAAGVDGLGGGGGSDRYPAFSQGGGDGVVIVALQFSAIPEPSSFLALGCLVGSGLMLRNRRRK